MQSKELKKGGFIQIIVIIVLCVIILSLLGVSLGSLINNKTLRENFVFLWQGIVWVWSHYIAGYTKTLWEFAKSKIY